MQWYFKGVSLPIIPLTINQLTTFHWMFERWMCKGLCSIQYLEENIMATGSDSMINSKRQKGWLCYIILYCWLWWLCYIVVCGGFVILNLQYVNVILWNPKVRKGFWVWLLLFVDVHIGLTMLTSIKLLFAMEYDS